MQAMGHTTRTPRLGTAWRLGALSVVALLLAFASLAGDPGGPSALAQPAGTAAETPAEPEPEPTITDEVLDWAEATLERVRFAIDNSAADAKRAVEASGGLRLLAPADEADPDTLHWNPIAPGDATPDRLVVLVHGLDEPGDIWDDLAPAIRADGLRVARFDYPNDQPIADSADLLGAALASLCASGTERIDLVCHSMGGLVARDVLTRDAYYAGHPAGSPDLPVVERLITVGTPNFGAPLAPLRGVSEIRDQLVRLVNDDGVTLAGLMRFSADGKGEAGIDLLPGSDFLTDLNARPLPAPLRMTVIIGRAAPTERARTLADTELSRAMGIDDDLDDLLTALIPIGEDIGDGVVPAASAALPGVEDTVHLEGNHRSVLRRIPAELAIREALGDTPDQTPPAIPVILDRLAEPVESGVEAGD